MKSVEFSLYVHIIGTVDVDEAPNDPNDLLDSIFPDGWEGEVADVFTDQRFTSNGYMEIHDLDDD